MQNTRRKKRHRKTLTVNAEGYARAVIKRHGKQIKNPNGTGLIKMPRHDPSTVLLHYDIGEFNTKYDLQTLFGTEPKRLGIDFLR